MKKGVFFFFGVFISVGFTACQKSMKDSTQTDISQTTIME